MLTDAQFGLLVMAGTVALVGSTLGFLMGTRREPGILTYLIVFPALVLSVMAMEAAQPLVVAKVGMEHLPLGYLDSMKAAWLLATAVVVTLSYHFCKFLNSR